MTATGTFRHWVEPFDRWHAWILPPVLVLLFAALFLARKPPTPIPLPSPAVSRTLTPAPTQVPPPSAPSVTPLRAARIDTPTPNAFFWRDRLSDVEGTAEPEARVQLYLGTRLLSENVADREGRFRFRLTNFPAGQHTIQVVAITGERERTSDPVIFTVKADAGAAAKPVKKTPVKPPVRNPPSKTTPPKTNPAKSSPQRPAPSRNAP